MLSFNIDRLEGLIRGMLCEKVNELHSRYVKEGKVLHAEFLKESFKECFS